MKALFGKIMGMGPSGVSTENLICPAVSQQPQLFDSSSARHISETSHTEWLNGIITNLWPFINEYLRTMLKETVEPVLQSSVPAPLKSIHFTEIDFGPKPLAINRVRVSPCEDASGRSCIEILLDLEFESDCDISLKASYIGGFGVTSFSLQGELTIILSPLIKSAPLVGGTQVYFQNPPEMKFDFSGLANVADFPFLAGIVRSVISSVISSVLVLPNRIAFTTSPEVDVIELQHPPGRGVLRLSVVKASGLHSERTWSKLTSYFKNSIADSFVEAKVGGKSFETAVVADDNTPFWDESEDFVVHNRKSQLVHLTVYDQEYLGAKTMLGQVSLTVAELLQQSRSAAQNSNCPSSPAKNYSSAVSQILSIRATSGGGESASASAGIWINGKRQDSLGDGVRFVVIDASTGVVKKRVAFDLDKSEKDLNEFLSNSESVPGNSIVVVVVSNTAENWTNSRDGLISIGSRTVRPGHGDRPLHEQPWILIGFKPQPGESAPSWVREKVGNAKSSISLRLRLAIDGTADLPVVVADEAHALDAQQLGNRVVCLPLAKATDNAENRFIYVKAQWLDLVSADIIKQPSSMEKNNKPSVLWVAVDKAVDLPIRTNARPKVVLRLQNGKAEDDDKETESVVETVETLPWVQPERNSASFSAQEEVDKCKIDRLRFLREKGLTDEEIAFALSVHQTDITKCLDSNGTGKEAAFTQHPSPLWAEAFSFFLEDLESDTLTVEVVDSSDQNKNTRVLATVRVPLSDMMKESKKTQTATASDDAVIQGYEMVRLHPNGFLNVKFQLFHAIANKN